MTTKVTAQKKSQELVDNLCFCVIDLETTGGNHTKDKIIEIGMVKIKERKIVDEKSFLINPEIPIPDFIQNLTNIKTADVKDAPLIETVIDEILEFIADDIIVAHNTSFDVPFLNSVLSRLKRPDLENKVICTNVMTKHMIPEILNSNLNYMSRLFKIKHSKAHRAHDDALATARLLVVYLDIFIKKGIRKVNQLYYPKNKFELDRIHLKKSQESRLDVTLQGLTNPTLVTVKGERGLILAVLPLENPAEELTFVHDILTDLEWQMITIRLVKPLLEGFFQFNNHFTKYPEHTKEKIVTYLSSKYINSENKETVKLEQIDFLLTHHLISDQIIAYPILNLNTNSKPLFKIPAQKKKLYQYFLGQINRFENMNKGRRKHLIHSELIELIQHVIENKKNENQLLFLSRKEIKENKDFILGRVEQFVKSGQNEYNFPNFHL